MGLICGPSTPKRMKVSKSRARLPTPSVLGRRRRFWGPPFPRRAEIPRKTKESAATQVLGTWQWAAYLHDEAVRKGKQPLLINLDESPMPLVYPNARGNVVRPRSLHPHLREPRRPATRNEQRIHFTFVAVICNIQAIQDILPQIIVVPKRALGELDWDTIDAELPNNVYLVRQPSMWVNTALHRTIGFA